MAASSTPLLTPNLACMFASVFIFFDPLPKTHRVLALALFPSPTRHPLLTLRRRHCRRRLIVGQGNGFVKPT